VKIGFAVSRGDLLAAVAGALGLTVSDVAQYLDAGHSLAELAAAHNVPRQTLREAILTEVRREIEAQVQAGALTAADGDRLFQKFGQDAVDQILDDKNR